MGNPEGDPPFSGGGRIPRLRPCIRAQTDAVSAQLHLFNTATHMLT